MERRGLWLGSVWVRAFVLGCGVGVSVWMFVVSRPFYHDDAYITLRYAHHLLQGQGIVWNLGESLQGYTNFLHLVLIAGLGACGVDLVVASRFVGGGAFAGLLLGVFWLRSVWELPTAQRTFSVQEGAPEALSVQEGAQGAWFLSFVLLLTSAPLVVWSWGGLEGNLFACFVAVGALLVMAASRHPKPLRLASAAGMVLAWSCLVRPEGWLFWGISWLWLGWFVARPQGSVRLFGAYGIGGLLCLLPYLCWQYAYYGELIPNTFYVRGSVGVAAWAWCVVFLEVLVVDALLVSVDAVGVGGVGVSRAQRRGSQGTRLLVWVDRSVWCVCCVRGGRSHAFVSVWFAVDSADVFRGGDGFCGDKVVARSALGSRFGFVFCGTGALLHKTPDGATANNEYRGRCRRDRREIYSGGMAQRCVGGFEYGGFDALLRD